jgi:polyisoprenyl-phosphate glycosyltransferase
VNLEIVIPVFNEEKVLPLLFQALDSAFSEENRTKHNISDVRYIFVDDGSQDLSCPLIEGYITAGASATLIQLSRNFGHQSSVMAGLRHSKADYVGIIDSDLQDPPHVLLEMLDRCRAGFEVAYGKRTSRKEGIFKKFGYWSFYRILKILSPVPVPLDAGDFCVMSRRMVREMCQVSESLPFPRGLRSWIGFPQVPVPYERCHRAAGRSKYSFRELYNLATNGITSLSIRPLQLAQTLSLLYMFLSFFFLSSLVLTERPMFGLDQPTFILLIFGLLSNSLIMFCFYILGAYVGRGYLETKGRPTFVIRNIIEGT